MSDDCEGNTLHIGVDASNIRAGGGVTHLSQLLNAADPRSAGVHRVTVWAAPETLDALPTRPWLAARSPAWTNAPLPLRALGQQWTLPRELRAEGCDVLFSPGGTLPRRCPIPVVTMSQNMLPFAPGEARRFGRGSAMHLKMLLLRIAQSYSFRNAEGLIFLTRYAKSAVTAALGDLQGAIAMIPHGVEQRFFQAPRVARELAEFSLERPFRLLYVSTVTPYKHQIEVARAVSQLRSEGLPIEIRFAGALWGRYGETVRKECLRLDPKGEFLHLIGVAQFAQLHTVYREADAFLFASSCENLPNILIEAMAAGLPIVSSSCGPMSEVLDDAAVYCDPESVHSIASAVRALTKDAVRRDVIARTARQRAMAYSWERCAKDTFAFIAHVARSRGR